MPAHVLMGGFTMLLIGNGRVVTFDSERPLIEDGAVLIDGERIAAVGERSTLRSQHGDARYVDAHGGLIMPGFINTHTHIYSGLARGLAIDGNNPTNFLEVLEGMWWAIDRKLTLDGTKASAYATILDCIRNGVTTIFDHHASFGEIPGSLFAIRDVAKEMGMRSCLCYEVSERDGEEKCEQSIRENAEFAKWAADANDDMIKAMFGGHALFTISDRTFERMAEANNGLTGFHIHVCEGINDVYDSLEHYGCRPVERLLYNGLLGPKTMLGHCIHVSPAEMDIIKETGTMTVNNPGSNMNNAVGCAPILQLMERGVTVGMGTDAYTHDMLESAKTFLLIQRHNAAMPNVAWNETFRMLFENNRQIAARYFDKPLGILKQGAAADVIVMDYKPFTPFLPENIQGHILFGLEGKNCRTTIINGKLLYEDRKFVEADEEALNAWIMEESKKLWGSLNNRIY
jgi:putative selenium metabolism protein SsnA